MKYAGGINRVILLIVPKVFADYLLLLQREKAGMRGK
jgi:hypothetical protein